MAIADSATETMRIALHRGVNPDNHVFDILKQVAQGLITGNKAHRFLGWAQAKLDANGIINLAEFREINRVTRVDD